MYVILTYVLCVCLSAWSGDRAISLSYSIWWRAIHMLSSSKLPPHPHPPPSSLILIHFFLHSSTSQFLSWPLRPALWPLSRPPELSLPLCLCDIRWQSGCHFLTPRYSPLPLLPCWDCLYGLFLLTRLLLCLISYLPFNPRRYYLTQSDGQVLCQIVLFSSFRSISVIVCTIWHLPFSVANVIYLTVFPFFPERILFYLKAKNTHAHTHTRTVATSASHTPFGTFSEKSEENEDIIRSVSMLDCLHNVKDFCLCPRPTVAHSDAVPCSRLSTS